MVKKFEDMYVYSFRQSPWPWQTDGRTGGRTDTAWRHTPRLHSIAWPKPQMQKCSMHQLNTLNHEFSQRHSKWPPPATTRAERRRRHWLMTTTTIEWSSFLPSTNGRHFSSAGRRYYVTGKIRFGGNSTAVVSCRVNSGISSPNFVRKKRSSVLTKKIILKILRLRFFFRRQCNVAPFNTSDDVAFCRSRERT